MGNTYSLRFTFLGRDKLSVTLRRGRIVAGALDVSLEGHLDEVLIPLLDRFLKNNRIDPFELGRITITARATRPDMGRVDRNSLAYRIVYTWVAALKAARNHNT